MSLVDRCSSSFSVPTRQKGDDYFRRGRVDLQSVSLRRVEALVDGSETYAVEVDLKQVRTKVHLQTQCSCPYFADGNLCKHVWAVIHAADKRGWGAEAKAARGSVTVKWNGDENDIWHDEYDDSYEDEDSNDADEQLLTTSFPRHSETPKKPSQKTIPLDWRHLLKTVNLGTVQHQDRQGDRRPVTTDQKLREIWYGINLRATREQGELTIDLFQKERRASGEWGLIKALKLDPREIDQINSAADQSILALLFGGKAEHESSYNHYFYGYPSSKYGRFKVTPQLYTLLLPVLAKSQRLALIDFDAERPNETPISYDDGTPWRFELTLAPLQPTWDGWLLEGTLRRDHDLKPLQEPKLILKNGLVIFDQSIHRLAPTQVEEFQWLVGLRERSAVKIPSHDLDRFIETAAQLPNFPKIEWPAATGWRQEAGLPKPRLSIMSTSKSKVAGTLIANVLYSYDAKIFRRRDPQAVWIAKQEQIVHQRNQDAEAKLLSQLTSQSPVSVDPPGETNADVRFPAAQLESLTSLLTELGWIVEADGRRIKRPGEFKAFVSSGVDWFDLQASCQYDKEAVKLPALLAALERGDQFIRLGDGSVGLLPSEWLRKFTAITELGDVKQTGIRFNRCQVAILDALIDELPEVDFDQRFTELRDRIRAFKGVEPLDPAPGFTGDLRDYQREGLGWLGFLTDFGFGGCLADDMGLGKTVQVLAMLHHRYTSKDRKAGSKASLVVVPRSLVQNWIKESARFSPDLKLLDYSSLDRHEKWENLGGHDVVVTTYGVLRRDIQKLRSVDFDYAILDEAQAIKNETAQVSKAARLIKAENKLALSGTPVENHLGELGSIFEYLNPGMLNPSLLADLSKNGADGSRETTTLLAKALRPFILRRTKAQVLKDLPEKTEQTLYCDMEPQQRKLYEELREHYRLHLTATIQQRGMERSKILVLEALLRLRQAACHPGLIDKERVNQPSAKLETLLGQLREIVDSGHKALVFSQFTSMLALVKSRLDREKISYEYLDGKTRDRQARVDRFQADASLPLFLISLKAGGLGLNLTSADYCFILDPWWNPAAEAQAIDRAHRMGQTKRVFAYRLIAKDTVEEKILALQEQKRDLANSIVSAENSVLRSLTLDDVQLLLS